MQRCREPIFAGGDGPKAREDAAVGGKGAGVEVQDAVACKFHVVSVENATIANGENEVRRQGGEGLLLAVARGLSRYAPSQPSASASSWKVRSLEGWVRGGKRLSSCLSSPCS